MWAAPPAIFAESTEKWLNTEGEASDGDNPGRAHRAAHRASGSQAQQQSQGLRSLQPASAWAPAAPGPGNRQPGKAVGRAVNEDQPASVWLEHPFFKNDQGVTVFKRRAGNDMENIIQSLQKLSGAKCAVCSLLDSPPRGRRPTERGEGAPGSPRPPADRLGSLGGLMLVQEPPFGGGGSLY